MPTFKNQSSLLRGFCGLILILVGILGDAAPAAEKTSLAVYPIKAVGAVDKSLAATMTSLVNYELTQSPKLLVIKEDMLQEVMKRQAMNISDLCDSTMCQVEIGKLVQAQKMVVGELSKLGNRYLLTINLVDIQTGTQDFSTKEQCQCSEDQLDQLAALASAKIREHFGETGIYARKAAQASNPSGAPTSSGSYQPTRSAEAISAETAAKIRRFEKIFQSVNVDSAAESSALERGAVYSVKGKSGDKNVVYFSTVVETPASLVWEAITDVENYCEFMSGCLSVNILERTSDHIVIQKMGNMKTSNHELFFDHSVMEMFCRDQEQTITAGLGIEGGFRGYKIEALTDDRSKLIAAQEGRGNVQDDLKAFKKRAEALAR